MRGAAGIEARLSSFIGRETEIAELHRLASSVRLLTLLGPGGCGKTRLATEFARQQESRFPDGRILVELADVHDGDLVGDAIARAAGITPQTGDSLATLVSRFRTQQLLLLADNCEHLTDAVAEVLARLLAECSGLVVLATSRERLNIEGEVVWRVPSMSIPESDAPLSIAAGTDAARLFVDRARSLRSGFTLSENNCNAVIGICRRLDGMPLAIELAAARITTLSPAEILNRLDDSLGLLTTGARNADERHRTLRAILDWSYDLLEPPDRLLLQRLSIFAGAVRIDAVHDICASASRNADSVLEGLQSLVDKSLVEVGENLDAHTRYRLLATVREYAAEKLAASGHHEEIRERHLAFYRRLAGDAFEARLRRGAIAEHRRLWEEMADVREALGWASRDPLIEIELYGSLKLIWLMYAPGEGMRRFNAIMPEVPQNPTTAHLRALWAGSALRGRMALRGRPIASPDDFIALGRMLGDDMMLAVGHLGNAYVAERMERDLPKARHHLGLAVSALEKLGDRCDLAMALCSLGAVEMQSGNLEAARPWVERGLEVAREADDDYGIASAYYTLGWLGLLSREPDDARADFLAALALAGEGDLLSVADQLQGIASAAVHTDAASSMTLFGAAQRIRDELETPLGPPWVFWVEPMLARARANLAVADSEAAWIAGRDMSTLSAVAMARDGVGASLNVAQPRITATAPASTAAATLRLEGEYWSLVFDGRTVRLRDTKGLRVLAQLLGDPAHPYPALDLERLGAPSDDLARAAASSDAGEYLDATARDAYRARVAELRDLIADAEELGKADAAGELLEELAFITRELSRAVGLGGRSRKAGSIAERARLNVTRAVKSAIQRVGASDAALGAHLSATVHTGVICVYTPDPRLPIGWQVSRGDTHPD